MRRYTSLAYAPESMECYQSTSTVSYGDDVSVNEGGNSARESRVRPRIRSEAPIPSSRTRVRTMSSVLLLLLPLAILLLLASSASAFFSPPSSSKSPCDGGFAHRQQHQSSTRRTTDLCASKAKQEAESRTSWSEKRGHGTATANDVQQSSEDKSSGRTAPPRLIIAGAPASGKGTQCELIQSRYGVVHLSTGDMLRAAVSAGTDVGMSAKEYMDSGKLVPDEVIIGVVSSVLN